MKPIIGLIVAPVLGIVILVFLIIYSSNPPEATKPADYNSSRIATIITEKEAEKAARDAVDEGYQRNGYEKGAVRGGVLGSTELIYLNKDGTSFAVNKYDGTLGDQALFVLDNAQRDHYYWTVILNFGNTTKPEYDFKIDAHSGKVLQMGVND